MEVSMSPWSIMVTWTRGVFWCSLTIWDINFAFLQWLPNLKRISSPEKTLGTSPGTFLYLVHPIFFWCSLGIGEFPFSCLYLPSKWYIFNKKIEEYFLNLSCSWVVRAVFWEKQMWNSCDQRRCVVQVCHLIDQGCNRCTMLNVRNSIDTTCFYSQGFLWKWYLL